MTKTSNKLWQKSNTELNPAVTKYIISRDLDADNRILPYDVQASKAHATMLKSVGLLTEEELNNLIKGLDEVQAKHKSGEFVLSQNSEDVHTAIESYLVQTIGETGKKIHVGRSRNDQVLTAMRLMTKAELQIIQTAIVETASIILKFAKAHEFVPLPGYTHMQHAMPSSFGQWAGAFVESLINDYTLIQSALELNDQNPLGSGSGFGSSVPLDREQTTKEMGFARLQINSVYCQNSRGKIEAFTISGLLQVMLTLGRLANDLVIFYSQEFGYVRIDSSLTTGSSMMPQKRNLDIMEVLRANVAKVQSYQLQCQTAGTNLISGYNKDLKITKDALIQSLDLTKASLDIVALLFEHMEPAEDKVLKAFENQEIFATDMANDLVMKGETFRDAYRKVGENLSDVETQDPVQNIKSKTHIGSTGNLQLDHYERILKDL